MKLWAALYKEMVALTRDIHALAALFVMPVVFILIMSLALQDTLSPESARKFTYVFDKQDNGELARTFIDRFAKDSRFTRATDESDPLAALRERRINFVVAVGPELEKRLTRSTDESPAAIRITAERGLSASMLALAEAQANVALMRLNENPEATKSETKLVTTSYVAADAGTAQPTAVQQSVPAWLVFGMFFIVIPLSTIFITERDQGTLRRLQAMGVSPPLFFAGKIVPFFLINQIQAVAMLLVGIYVVPLFGGEALTLNGSPIALMLLLGATSLAAVGYALVVAVSAGTIAQATIIGGVGNILLGAIGGIMAPKFLMPITMQRIADASPMSWALDGMLEVLLHGSGAQAVAWRAGALVTFAAACLLIAGFIFYRRNWRP